MQKMSPTEIVSIVRGVIVTVGIVSVVTVISIFSDVHWGWKVAVAVLALGMLENQSIRNLGGK